MHRFHCPHCLDHLAAESLNDLAFAINRHNQQAHPTDPFYWTSDTVERSANYYSPDSVQGIEPRHLAKYQPSGLTDEDRAFLKENLVAW
jgi:hypothetical protein